MTTVVATGALDDGRSFRYHATETGGAIQAVEIVFSSPHPLAIGLPRGAIRR